MDFTGKRSVVTGGAGFIGSHLVDALIAAGSNVTVIDDLSAGNHRHVNPKAEFYQVDIRDLVAIQPLFTGVDYVFHLAARPRVQYSIEHPDEAHSVNVTGMLNVLIAASAAKVKRLVYSASSSAYGDSPQMPLTEDLPVRPKSPYGLQKYLGELHCRLWSEIYDLPTVSLRYFNVYGPRQNPEGPYALVIGKFLQQKASGQPLTITGDGTQTRDFTHVQDVVRANLLAATSEKVGAGEVINIGAGRNVSINDLAKMLGGPIKYIETRLEPHDTLADNSRARQLLNWQPEVRLEQGIEELLK